MLRIDGLGVSYGDRPVLRDVSLEVRRGEVVSLVGPNGCGKTTLLRAITRVVPWVRGDVCIGEASTRDLPARDLARLVAVVPQNPQLPLGYSAFETVLMGRTPHLGFFEQEGGDDLRRAGHALERVGAAHLAHRRVDELSGGERQNVVLARALAQDTPLLLLDEPTANLDIGHQIAVARLVRELAAGGLAILAAVHDLTLASLYSDRIVLMSDGRVVTSGSPGDVLTAAAIRQAYGADVTILRGVSPRPIIVPASPDGA
jgi:iron complex transport system ATP-binding protein